ncbi:MULTISPECIES: MAG0490 family ComEA-like DNA-binding protein [unclassified Mycoplasma]|uniref:MAG0490 family ComEA-like DNA-binding protein n=1 Tax=unclassified Mycoplasma TaxID=2683645 RepID=UPI002B1D62DE|nr:MULTISPECIES: helix-hairpin-helix domain-containing protein [unclassified Mycoplasma]MEA4191147.1 helix-hairpin-helix domain-containing protein [Mycoplasma sp. 2248]MEA4206246.1 helix-hairpin-helix domain-containing protein [Mycoplasma sp. 1199]
MKKIGWFNILLVIICLSSGVFISVVKFTEIKQTKKIDDELNKQKKIYKYTVAGNVLFPATFESDKPLSYRDVFNKVKLKTSSDISRYNLDDLATTSSVINVGLRKYKIKWEEIKDVETLKWLGLNSRVAKLIYKHREKNESLHSWRELLDIKGISTRTIEYLQTVIELT